MHWSPDELQRLQPLLEPFLARIGPVEGKRLLVLCSAEGDVAFWLAGEMSAGRITGLERDPDLLARARERVWEQDLERLVEFREAEETRIPFPQGMFDAVLSDFILYPSTLPTLIGHAEMARVLKPGGYLALTDVITTRPLSQARRRALCAIGFDYFCEATESDFRHWMSDAGLRDVQSSDVTSHVRTIWEERRTRDPVPAHQEAYDLLLDDPELALGQAIHYLYVSGMKP